MKKHCEVSWCRGCAKNLATISVKICTKSEHIIISISRGNTTCRIGCGQVDFRHEHHGPQQRSYRMKTIHFEVSRHHKIVKRSAAQYSTGCVAVRFRHWEHNRHVGKNHGWHQKRGATIITHRQRNPQMKVGAQHVGHRWRCRLDDLRIQQLLGDGCHLLILQDGPFRLRRNRTLNWRPPQLWNDPVHCHTACFRCRNPSRFRHFGKSLPSLSERLQHEACAMVKRE